MHQQEQNLTISAAIKLLSFKAILLRYQHNRFHPPDIHLIYQLYWTQHKFRRFQLFKCLPFLVLWTINRWRCIKTAFSPNNSLKYLFIWKLTRVRKVSVKKANDIYVFKSTVIVKLYFSQTNLLYEHLQLSGRVSGFRKSPLAEIKSHPSAYLTSEISEAGISIL